MRYFFCGSFMGFFFCLVFAMSLCASVYMCFVITCWERADLLALVCGVLLWICEVWYMIVSIPDLCTLTYLSAFSKKYWSIRFIIKTQSAQSLMQQYRQDWRDFRNWQIFVYCIWFSFWHLSRAVAFCLIIKLSLFHCYPESGVVLDSIDSWYLPTFLLCYGEVIDKYSSTSLQNPVIVFGTDVLLLVKDSKLRNSY